MHVAFINENMLGHTSYLAPYMDYFRESPGLGVTPHRIDAAPLPRRWARWANFSIRGLRRFGLDMQIARWRLVTSAYVEHELSALRRKAPISAVLVNTQSVGLSLTRTAAELPVFVCLDATFRQLSASPWFAPNWISRRLLPLTTAALMARERDLFAVAYKLLPWSERVRQSLIADYGTAEGRIELLPPVVELQPAREASAANHRPQLLFVGADFRRKGGALALECYRRFFRGKAHLHIVTHTDVAEEEGVSVHRAVRHRSEDWRLLWSQADVLIFPSSLETFGIVILEALSFGVPVVATNVGAAQEILGDGRGGFLIERPDVEQLAAAIEAALGRSSAGTDQGRKARSVIEERYELERNAQRLGRMLHAAAAAA